MISFYAIWCIIGFFVLRSWFYCFVDGIKQSQYIAYYWCNDICFYFYRFSLDR